VSIIETIVSQTTLSIHGCGNLLFLDKANTEMNSDVKWSLEEEICRVAGSINFMDSLIKLNLIEQGAESFSIVRDKHWVPGGSETYIYRFWIKYDDGGEYGYILKACIALSPGRNGDEIVREWVRRRMMIQSTGVQTPRLVAHKRGILLEELVPYKLEEVLHQLSRVPESILHSLARWAGVLSALGFAAIDPFSDLRSHGNDIVVVDFGEDLGPAHACRRPSAARPFARS
jgi:hypothetical protein